MIVIGLDVHKQSVTAVAIDEAGRPLAEKAVAVGSSELLGWAAALDGERLWAVEDCRQLTGWLERQLLSVGEDLVRVPPKLTLASPGLSRVLSIILLGGRGMEPSRLGKCVRDGKSSPFSGLS